MSSVVLTINRGISIGCSLPDVPASAPSTFFVNAYRVDDDALVKQRPSSRGRRRKLSSQMWELCSSAQTADTTVSDEAAAWEACRGALSAFSFSTEDQDKILGKAFGRVHSPYWSEEREVETPRYETVCAILDYLRSLSLSDDDLAKLLKKFPEVLGCGLENELKNNVQILAKDWGIDGKSLRNLLLRNPKVLGFNIDCKGDCMAQCTRCWARF